MLRLGCERRFGIGGSRIPNRLQLLLHVRLASVAADSNLNHHHHNAEGNERQSLYPYPTHPRPTPHQIFHLPHGATQKEIKARYYDLVRIHHPDSPHCRSLSPSIRHARFQSITSAYDTLRGKTPFAHAHSRPNPGSGIDPYFEELERRKRAYYAGHTRRAEYTHYTRHNWNASADDRWKDRLILAVGIITLMVGLTPSVFVMPTKFDQMHKAAVENLSRARDDAKMVGEEQRVEIRKRVNETKAQGKQQPRTVDAPELDAAGEAGKS